jgi:hypothetical protein
MQFHARQNMGGTVIAYDGKIRKIGMKNDSILSAGVYPAWHPWLKLIVYSTNMTSQTFHSVDPNKIEVFDTWSDLIAYDVEKNEVTNIENDPAELECFPFWAPDGKTLYYCSAHFEYQDTIDNGKELIARGVHMQAVSVEDKGEGLSFNVFCYNVQPGIDIDYTTGESSGDGRLDTGDAQLPLTRAVPEETSVDYILNTNTKKFHYPGCSSVSDMKEKNKKEYSGSREDLIAQGYEPCGRCNP